MTVERRGFLRLLGRVAALVAGSAIWPLRQLGAAVISSETLAASDTLAVRAVAAPDATALKTIMTSSVADADAFFGKCGGWSLAWAEDLVLRCPDSVVLNAGTTPIAFLEIPPIRPEVPPLAKKATDDERESHATRLRNRTTFRVTAAGVRDDLLSKEDSVAVFRTLLHQAFVRARELGYEYVEAIAPWERHPRMAQKWTDYPGCELVEPPSYSQEGGHDLYWLRWRLADAITALATESAQVGA